MNPSLTVQSGSVSLAVYQWGKPSASKPTVVLVHGYPDNAGVWKATAEALAKTHHVVAYDVRGAGLSSRPKATRDYQLQHLVKDLAAVAKAVSPTKPIHLVGHDWGSIQSWEAVCTPLLAGRIASYTSISGISLDHAAHWMRSRLASRTAAGFSLAAKQLAHSWYIALFQLPLLPAAAWRLGVGKLWPTMLEKLEGMPASAPSATQTEDGLAGMQLYRANVLQRLRNPQQRHTSVPVQLIVARRDRFMVRQILDDLAHWAPNLTRREVDAGHWIVLSHPAVVAQHVGAFIASLQKRPSRQKQAA